MTRPWLRQFGWFRYLPALLMLVCVSAAASAQSSDGMTLPQVPVNPQFPRDASGVNPLDGPQAMRRQRQLNAARQKAMVSDATKLLALARELNDELTANKGNISPAVQMKKIAEIEKLAHSVKERMSYIEGAGINTRNNLMNRWP